MTAPSICTAPRCPNARPCPQHPAPARGNSRGWHWSTVIVPRIRRRDGNACVLCGRTDGPLDVDHIIPKERGGTDTDANLRLVCRSYNRGGRCTLPGRK